MYKVLTDIGEYIFDKIEVVTVFLIVAGGMYIVNIVLGSLDGLFRKEFDWKKHFYGVGKASVACFSILMFCILLNMFTYGLSLIQISIPDMIVTVGEIIVIIVAWIKDLAIDITDKIKGMKTLKYIKYEDVKIENINDYDVDQNIGGLL